MVAYLLDERDTDEKTSTSADDFSRAVLNVLEDYAEEKQALNSFWSAIINLLEDFDSARQYAEQTNCELRKEIAERLRTDQALRHAKAATETANRELDAFSYSVAHDLRAPLRSIDGFSQALVEDFSELLPDEAKTHLGYIRDSAQHMARLIDDLLSLARVSRREIHRSPTNLAAIARTIVTRLRKEEPHRVVDAIIPAELIAVGDSVLLTAVLENLLANAWKFTGRRAHARIELGTSGERDISGDAGSPVYFVRDDGAGFNMEYSDKLFSVFQRLHSVSEFAGTGIGLANVERIVRRHGGRIWADGEVGRGATFFFTLPDQVSKPL